jgi:hypothetical protein
MKVHIFLHANIFAESFFTDFPRTMNVLFMADAGVMFP